MIPYVPQPVFHPGPLTIHAFGVTAAAALVSGYWLALRRARRQGLSDRYVAMLVAAIAIGGLTTGFAAHYLFIGGNAGMSSAGLAAGACLTAWILLFRTPDRWRYFDVFAFAFPVAGAIARLGCFLAHDHIGARTDSWLGVQFPGGTRFDLGLLHFIATIIVAGLIVLLSHRIRTPGILFGTMSALIGASRLLVLQSGDALGLALMLGGIALTAQRWR